MYKIYYDSIQEGVWFQKLHPDLENAGLYSFPSNRDMVNQHAKLQKALSFDRPDIILCDEDEPILVIERTVEVPSGHNVGQRFARLVAAAEQEIPVIYFGPYAAYKHGGATQGPRYMNLRLFYALEKMSQLYGTAISIINWPVDIDYEIIRNTSKDTRIREYLEVYFEHFRTHKLTGINEHITQSPFETRQQEERKIFIQSEVSNPDQYDTPPDSISIVSKSGLALTSNHAAIADLPNSNCVVYKIGMKYIRSDPYTGMSMLYSFLYCGGIKNRSNNLVLHFPNISLELWDEVSTNNTRKDVRLFKMVSDAIIFSNGCLMHEEL